jgi:ligand-binding sensor domain-containing protein
LLKYQLGKNFNKLFKVLSILLSFYSPQVSSQVFSFRNFTEDDGLSQSFIYDICRDNRGFLVIATGDGLSAYGGYTFRTFKASSGLAEIGISAMLKDSKNKIWLGHFEGGVSLVLPSGKIDKVTFKEPLSAKLIQILEIGNDNYVFLKKNTGIVIYNSSTGKTENIQDEGFGETSAILLNKDELLFLKPDGVYAIKIKNLLSKNYKTYRLLKLNEGVTMQFNIAKDNLIIADNNLGLLTYKVGINFSPLDTFKLKRINSSFFTKIISDRFSNIYVATSDDGFYKINPSTKLVSNYTIKNGLASNAIQTLFIDREDNLWIGTYGFGLQQLNNEMYSYRFIKDNEGIRIPINGIVKLNDKTIVTTYKGIGFVVDDKIDFIKNNLLANKNFKNLMFYKNNFIFSSAEGELFKSDTLFNKITKITLKTTNEKLIINSISSDEKSIFACTSAGLYIINPETAQYEVLNTESGLMHNNVKFVYVDSKKHMWVCSQGSLIYYVDNYKDVKIFDDVKTLKNFNIQTISEDSKNNVWISSLGDGVFKYNGKNFENYSVANGLKSLYSYAIVSDYKNGIWVAHNNAISYKNANKKNFNRIGGNSELLQSNFIENSVFYDKKTNEVFFGTTEGFMKINTAKQKFNEVEPKVSILNVSINGDRLTNFSDTILNYNSYDFSFDFIGICLSDPQSVKYKYKLTLEGENGNWEFIGSETRKLNFPKLKNGKYTFIIYAANNDGMWTSTPVVYKFTIDKPYWLKLWFIITSVLSLSLIIFVGIKWRTKKLIANQKELEHKIHLQTIEIRSEKEHISKMNVELKTLHDDLRDSINYAKNIQSSIIPHLQNQLGAVDIFEYFQPKDVVGGDFYGYYSLPNNNKIVFIADCTGHGVPGGFLTVIAKALLDKIVIEMKIYNPKEIIHKLNSEFRLFFSANASDQNIRYEGLVITMCYIDYLSKHVQVCAAGNPFYYSTKNSSIINYKGSRRSVGYQESMGDLEALELPIDSDLRLYLFTDGLQDQFGSSKSKRFSSKKVAEALEVSKNLSVQEQGINMLEEWKLWKAAAEQVDDVSIIIIKFN